MGEHVDEPELAAGLDEVRRSPADAGSLTRIVARPAEGERDVLPVAELSLELGLVGDNWLARGNRRTTDGSADPLMQLNLTNSRFLALIAPDEADQLLAGDQLHVDLDLSEANLPPWTRLQIGDAVIEITDKPHNGCAKYARRYGDAAVRFVNSPEGKALHLRGINARVVEPGTIRAGDAISKLP